MNLAQSVNLYCYGTSEGAKKAWDSIGRKGSDIAIAKAKNRQSQGLVTKPTEPAKISVVDKLRSEPSFSQIIPFSEKTPSQGPIVIAPTGEIFSVTAHQAAARAIDEKSTYGTTYKVLEKNDVVRGVISYSSLNFEIFSKPSRAQIDNMVSLAQHLSSEKQRTVFVDVGSRENMLNENFPVDDLEKLPMVLEKVRNNWGAKKTDVAAAIARRRMEWYEGYTTLQRQVWGIC